MLQGSERSTHGTVEGIELLTVKEVAAKLKVSTATVYSLVERGELAHVRVMNSIRISGASLRRWTNDKF